MRVVLFARTGGFFNADWSKLFSDLLDLELFIVTSEAATCSIRPDHEDLGEHFKVTPELLKLFLRVCTMLLTMHRKKAVLLCNHVHEAAYSRVGQPRAGRRHWLRTRSMLVQLAVQLRTRSGGHRQGGIFFRISLSQNAAAVEFLQTAAVFSAELLLKDFGILYCGETVRSDGETVPSDGVIFCHEASSLEVGCHEASSLDVARMRFFWEKKAA